MLASRRFFIGSAAFVALSLAPLPASAMDQMSLKLSSFLPRDHIITQQVLLPFARQVEDETKGEITIRIFPAGELSKSIGEQLQLVDSGVVDMALVLPELTPGRFPDMSFVSLPDLIPEAKTGSKLLTEMYFGRSREMSFDFSEIIPIGYFVTPPYFLHTSQPVASLGDIAGRKIRSNSGVSSVLQRLGATPVSIPSSEVIPAAERGVVDGAALSWDQYRALSAHQALPFSIDINLGGARPVLLVVRRSLLESLADFQREAIFNAAGAALADRWGSAYNIEASVVATDLDIRKLDPDSAAKYAEIAANIQQEWVAAGGLERSGDLERAKELLAKYTSATQ